MSLLLERPETGSDIASFAKIRRWPHWAALALPWLMAAAVLGLIVQDWGRTASTVYVDANEMARTGYPQEYGIRTAVDNSGSATAADPVCNMTVRAASAEKAVYKGTTYHFCSSYCRAAFVEKPEQFLGGAPRQGHSMRGIPTRLYQWGLVILLLISFGLIELVQKLSTNLSQDRSVDNSFRNESADDAAGCPGAPSIGGSIPRGMLAARLTLPVTGLLRSRLFPGALRAVTAAAFLLVIAAGLFGSQNPGLNIAPLLTWTVWWTGLIFAVLYLGKAWCTVCPWDAMAGWVEKVNGGLGLPWPKALRNIWPAVALFVALTWVELGMGITLIPRATAWVALGMLGLAAASALLFDRKAFCRYGCLVGRVSGLYALFSSIEVRAADKDACASCRSLDCYKGNARGAGCPTFEFPRALALNTYCTMCAECFKTCPSGSMALRLRPWAADLASEGKPRADEAVLALILLSMTAFHGLTMTPTWAALLESTRAATGLSFMAAFTALMAFFLAAPALVYAALAWVSASWGRTEFKPLFLRFAYALLPIALFYHLAHNAEHFLMEGPKVLALASDPFGWGWDLLGTAGANIPPLVTLEGLWRVQVLFVLVGHVYSLWITARTARRLAGDDGSFVLQLPMLAAMVAFSWGSLWLLKQPMEMRLSAM